MEMEQLKKALRAQIEEYKTLANRIPAIRKSLLRQCFPRKHIKQS